MHQGQRGEEFDPCIGCMWRQRNGLSVHQPQFVDALLNGVIVEQDAETQCVREEIAHRNLALRRDGIVERSINPAQYAAAGQFGKPAVGRCVKLNPAVLDQHHHAGRRDRLGHRGDAEDRVASHRGGSPNRLRTDHVYGHIVTLGDKPNGTREQATGQLRFHERAQTHKFRREGR